MAVVKGSDSALAQNEAARRLGARANIGRERLREARQSGRILSLGCDLLAVRTDRLANFHGRTKGGDRHPDTAHPEEATRASTEDIAKSVLHVPDLA